MEKVRQEGSELRACPTSMSFISWETHRLFMKHFILKFWERFRMSHPKAACISAFWDLGQASSAHTSCLPPIELILPQQSCFQDCFMAWTFVPSHILCKSSCHVKLNLHPNFRYQTVKSPLKEAGSVQTNWEPDEMDAIPGPALGITVDAKHQVMLYCHDLKLLALNC